MRGVVNARREAIVTLRVRGPSGSEFDIDTLIDSGYTGSLVLPSSIIAKLGLISQLGGKARLADGSIHQFPIYRAELFWDGDWQLVVISALGDEALLGMSLLAGHELRVEVVPGGVVEIIPLP